MVKHNGPKLRSDVGGFRAVWLIFFEAFITGTMILIWAQFGFWYAAVLIVPFFWIVKIVESYEIQVTYDMEAWQKALDMTRENYSLPFPELNKFRTETQKPKPTLNLRKKLKFLKPNTRQNIAHPQTSSPYPSRGPSSKLHAAIW